MAKSTHYSANRLFVLPSGAHTSEVCFINEDELMTTDAQRGFERVVLGLKQVWRGNLGSELRRRSRVKGGDEALKIRWAGHESCCGDTI